LLTIFGGPVDDLESFLIEERIPEGWESLVRKKMGHTLAAFTFTLFKVERGIDENKYEARIAAEVAAGSAASVTTQ